MSKISVWYRGSFGTSTSNSFRIRLTFLVISEIPLSPPYSSTFIVLSVARSPSSVYLESLSFLTSTHL